MIENTMQSRRAQPRIQVGADVSVKVQSAPDNPTIEGKSFSCMTEDISINGLKLRTDTDIPINTLLEMEISTKGSNDKYLFTGSVLWINEISNSDSKHGKVYNAGIILHNSSSPQFWSWSNFINKLLK